MDHNKLKTGSPEMVQVPSPSKKNFTSPEVINEASKNAVEKAKEASADDIIQIPGRDHSDDEDQANMIVKLSNIYSFEGKTYREIDLSGLKNLTAVDIIKLEKMFYSDGNIAPINEMSTPYTLRAAALATDLPIELFNAMKANDTVKIKNAVSSFLLA